MGFPLFLEHKTRGGFQKQEGTFGPGPVFLKDTPHCRESVHNGVDLGERSESEMILVGSHFGRAKLASHDSI